nr:hypothetical protein [Tanacetum cinerariifolium]
MDELILPGEEEMHIMNIEIPLLQVTIPSDERSTSQITSSSASTSQIRSSSASTSQMTNPDIGSTSDVSDSDSPAHRLSENQRSAIKLVVMMSIFVSRGILIESIDEVYRELVCLECDATSSEYQPVSTFEFDSHQQLVLSGVYKFRKNTKLLLFSIRNDPYGDIDSKSFMVSSAASKDDSVQRLDLGLSKHSKPSGQAKLKKDDIAQDADDLSTKIGKLSLQPSLLHKKGHASEEKKSSTVKEPFALGFLTPFTSELYLSPSDQASFDSSPFNRASFYPSSSIPLCYTRIFHLKFFASPIVLLAFLSILRRLQFSFGPILYRSRKSQSLGTLKLHRVFLYWCWDRSIKKTIRGYRNEIARLKGIGMKEFERRMEEMIIGLSSGISVEYFTYHVLLGEDEAEVLDPTFLTEVLADLQQPGHIVSWIRTTLGSDELLGATVITSLANAISVVGDTILTWLWGVVLNSWVVSRSNHLLLWQVYFHNKNLGLPINLEVGWKKGCLTIPLVSQVSALTKIRRARLALSTKIRRARSRGWDRGSVESPVKGTMKLLALRRQLHLSPWTDTKTTLQGKSPKLQKRKIELALIGKEGTMRDALIRKRLSLDLTFPIGFDCDPISIHNFIKMSNTNNTMQTQTSNTLHNAIIKVGGKDRPPMLAPGNYVQWKSRIKRYIDTKSNHELIHYCLQNLPYKYKWADKDVPVAEGIDNDTYSTVDACPNACEMWKAIERLKQVITSTTTRIAKHQNEVNEIRAERLARTANPHALVAQQQLVYHPQNHPTHYTQNSSTRSQQAATRNRGKTIVNSLPPIYDQEPSMVAEDDEMSKDNEIDKIQADWKDDTDDKPEYQELEAHYMYMAQIREVTPDAADNSRPIFDTEPLQKAPNNDNYNVFAIESEHPEQSKYINDTYSIKQDEHNVIIDSLDMSEIEDFKTKNKSLESSKNHFKEANNELSKTNQLMYNDIKKFQAELDRYNDVKQTIAKRTYFGHIDSFIQNTIEGNFCPEIRRINADLQKFHLCLKEEMVADLRYFNSLKLEVDSLKSQLETQKTHFLNKIDQLSRKYYYADHMNAILGVYTELDNVTNLQCDYLETLEKCECLEKELSKRVISPTSVSRPQLKSNQMEDRVMLNNSQGKKQEVEDHRRNVKFSKNKTYVTACNDSLNAKTSNVNFICVTCGKCMLKDKHDICVLYSLNGVNSRTKMPMVVPISTREPKRTVNQSVAKPLKRTVAS